MLDSFLTWTQSTLMPFGIWGVGLLAFMESAFFPIPPEVLLFPLVLLDPSNALWYALIATISSTFGSFLGREIGRRGGKPLLKKFASTANINRAEKLFKKYGSWSLAISGFTPIPYKVFTITAGALNHNDMVSFTIACTLGRGARFFIAALVLSHFGPQLLPFVEEQLGLFALGLIILLLAIWLGWRFTSQKLLSQHQ